MKKTLSLLLSGVLSVSLLAGCGGGTASQPSAQPSASGGAEAEASASPEGTTITVGASPAPHAEILEVVKDLLAEQGSHPGDPGVRRLYPPPTRLWRTVPWTPTTSSTSPT